VILFGSQVRGDAREDSDWDILILLNKEKLDNSDHDNYSEYQCSNTSHVLYHKRLVEAKFLFFV